MIWFHISVIYILWNLTVMNLHTLHMWGKQRTLWWNLVNLKFRGPKEKYLQLWRTSII
jgi:hypothetical protein